MRNKYFFSLNLLMITWPISYIYTVLYYINIPLFPLYKLYFPDPKKNMDKEARR